jgi:hypothetical protein
MSELNWRDLNAALKTCSELEAETMLKQEREGKNRPAWLMRIYGRFSLLRTERERAELFSKPQEG